MWVGWIIFYFSVLWNVTEGASIENQEIVEVERTSKYRTSNTSNIDTPNFEHFEHFEHDAQILRPNFEQARPNIELLSKIKNTDNSANKNN